MVQPIREVSPESVVFEGGAPVAHVGVLAQEALEVVPPEARRCIEMSNSSMLFVPLKYRMRHTSDGIVLLLELVEVRDQVLHPLEILDLVAQLPGPDRRAPAARRGPQLLALVLVIFAQCSTDHSVNTVCLICSRTWVVFT